jgi:adenylate cyclase
MPPQIREAILRQQDDSEVIISWVQLTIVCVWSLLYLASPKSYPADAPFVPVPWALGPYAAFGLFRLYLAYQRKLGTGILTLSVIVDMAVLTALLVSFPVQYMQPASFALKLPTMMYLFIFIAIRALRFDARYVLLSGGIASLAWLGVVIYAITRSPTEAGVTTKFVDYMTSNRILIGAEIDKLITLVSVTLILSLAISRARNLMIEAASIRVAATDLSRFVPSEVARRITEMGGESAHDVQTTEATILYIDVENFTGMAEHVAPEKVIKSLNEFFATAVEPIEKYRGAVTQFQGDAILASFNLPSPDTNHAKNAVSAAKEILQALATQQFQHGMVYRVRIGISTGQVTGGLVGVTDRVSYTVHGDAVNLAARLESLNKTLGTRLLISARTANRLRDEELSLVDTINIRGRQEPEPVYTLL